MKQITSIKTITSLKNAGLILIFILFFNKVYSQTMSITHEEQRLMKRHAKDVVLKLSEVLILLDEEKFTDEQKNSFIQQILVWFETENAPVYNDLNTNTKNHTSIKKYMHHIKDSFPDGIFIDYEIEKISDIFTNHTKTWFFLKIELNREIHFQTDNQKPGIEKSKVDVYIKYIILNNKVNLTPQIYRIENHQENAGDFILVQVIEAEESRFIMNAEEFNAIKSKQKTLEAIILQEKIIRLKQQKKLKITIKTTDDRQLERIEDQMKREQAMRQKYKAEKRRRWEEKQRREREQLRKWKNRAKEEKELALLLSRTKRLVFNIGGGIYYYPGTLHDIVNGNDPLPNVNLISPQISLITGLRFDFRNRKNKNRLRRGNLFAIFCSYGYNTRETIHQTIEDQKLMIDTTKKRFYTSSLETETGFILAETIRTSLGFGFIDKQSYWVSTFGINFNVSHFILSTNLSVLYGQQFKNLQLRPSINMQFQFNRKTAYRFSDNKKRFYYQANMETVYYFLNHNEASHEFTDFSDLLGRQLTGMIGIRVGGSVFGIYGNFGYNHFYLAKRLVTKQNIENRFTLKENNNFNQYNAIEAGGLLWNKWRISFGVGRFHYTNNEQNVKYMNYQIVTTGIHQPVFKWLNIHFDGSTLFNGDMQKTIFRIGLGVGLQFDFMRI